MRAYERFLNYIQYDTASDPASTTCPSTKKQLALGRALADEMKAMGICDARIDEHGYVYGSIPANAEGLPAIGLIAHMDVVFKMLKYTFIIISEKTKNYITDLPQKMKGNCSDCL